MVRPLWEKRRRLGARDPLVTHLAFLESSLPDPTPRKTAAEVDKTLRQWLKKADWHRDPGRIRDLLATTAERVEAPLIELLERDRSAWSRLWQRKLRPEHLEAALVLLSTLPSDRAKTAAHAYLEHPSPKVRRAAALVFGSA